MRQPPIGTITFLFTDIQGSTRLWQDHPDAMRFALARHDALLRDCIEAHDGYLVKTTGDGVHAAFADAADALAAVLSALLAFQAEPWAPETPLKIRLGLHTGAAEWRDGDYYGSVVNRAARLMAAGHGGQALLSQVTQELTRDTLPAAASLRDLGERRLKDLARPERIFQLLHPDLPADFPPLRSLDNPDLPNNLPQQMTSFIGRATEISEVKTLLEGTRLLTLAGAGGAGKTRLSLQVAADLLDHYYDGVWLVELAPLADPTLVPQAVASVLGIEEQAGQAMTRTLMDALKPKRLLLVLDNCEHLVSACAALAADLLRSCPGVHLLASSREPLNVAGERTYRVPSLSRADPMQALTVEALSQYEAVRLFIERAQAAQPNFSVTEANAPALAQVCWTLDGIPLAIELAAVRVRVLTVEEINARLADRFRLLTGGSRMLMPRQQTLRALIDWSYDLLTEPEKSLLRRLSVFAGGWSLEAAETVCAGDEIAAGDVLDLLMSLVDKSLVIAETEGEAARYRSLETVRQYGRDRLAESGEGESVGRRHRDFFLRLSEEARPKLSGSEQGLWLSRLETDHDNLRAALACCDQDGTDLEAGLRLCESLMRFWLIRGYLSEGLQWSGRALSATDGSEASAARARVLTGAGSLARNQGDYAAARAFCEQGLEIQRRLGNQQGIAQSLNGLGSVTFYQGDYAAARALHEQSLEIYRRIGSPQGSASALNNLGIVTLYQGDYAAARTCCDQSLEIERRNGNQQGIAQSLNNLGNVAYDQGNYEPSRAFHEESLQIQRRIGNQQGVAQSLNNLGLVAYEQGDLEAARIFHEEGLEIKRRIGDRQGIAQSLNNLGIVAFDQGDAETARVFYVQGLEIQRQIANPFGIVPVLESLAVLESSQGRPERGVCLWGAAAALREQIGAPVPLNKRQKQEQEIATRRQALGEAAFTVAFAAGRAMAMQQAVEYALSRV